MNNPWPQEYWVIETNCGQYFVEALPEWLVRATVEGPRFEDAEDPTGGWIDAISGQRTWLSWGHIAEMRHSTRENRATLTELSRWHPDADEPEPETLND